MKEMLVGNHEVETEGRRPFEYYILVGQMEINGAFACESYGVKIVGPDGREAAVPDITISVSRIDELMELLRRNNVPPEHLRDVVEDWL